MKLKVAHIAPDDAEPTEEKKLPLHKDIRYLHKLKIGFIEHTNKQIANRKARTAIQANQNNLIISQ